MKKTLVFAASIALTMLAACSSEEVQKKTMQEELGYVPISLGIGQEQVSVSQSRGTGTVGGLEGDSNAPQWNGEHIRVLMTWIPDDTHEWGFTTCGELEEQFNHKFYCIPEPDDGESWKLNYMNDSNNKRKYYPMNGSSEFFAYYADDAVKDYGSIKGSLVQLEIDGSQDIMAGKASNPIVEGKEIQGYSAATARKGIMPTIPMSHLLTRLTFQFVAGHENANGLKINAVRVKSRSEARLLAAYNDPGKVKNPDDLLEFDGNLKDLYLGGKDKDNKIHELTPVSMKTEGKDLSASLISVGDALFVEPNQKQYEMSIDIDQPTEDPDQKVHQDVPLIIKLSSTDKFKRGCSYNVKITVYGLSDISVNVELEPWKEGGEIDITTSETI